MSSAIAQVRRKAHRKSQHLTTQNASNLSEVALLNRYKTRLPLSEMWVDNEDLQEGFDASHFNGRANPCP